MRGSGFSAGLPRSPPFEGKPSLNVRTGDRSAGGIRKGRRVLQLLLKALEMRTFALSPLLLCGGVMNGLVDAILSSSICAAEARRSTAKP